MTSRPTRLRLGAALGTALVLAIGLPQPASAAPPTVTSPSCGALELANSSGAAVLLALDSGITSAMPNGGRASLRGQSAGTYTWVATNASSGRFVAKGSVQVAACAGQFPRRPRDGDQNGDNRADVLGIQAGTGDLYYYPMTSTGLAGGSKAGSGWNNMVFMQQVNEIDGANTPNRLVAVRNDGTVWSYDNHGAGKFGNGRQIGAGLAGYRNFTVLGLNNTLAPGNHLLLASKGDVLYAMLLNGRQWTQPEAISTGWSKVAKTIAVTDMDGDRFADLVTVRTDGTLWRQGFVNDPLASTNLLTAPVQVGRGWGQMGIVTSPGSLDVNASSDLISRRNDGNLYKFLTSSRGGVGQAVKIGKNWNRIRLLS